MQAARSTLFSVIPSIFSLLGMRLKPSTQPFLANHWPLRKLPAVRLEFGLRVYFHSCNSRSGNVERLPLLHGGIRLLFSFLPETGGQSRFRTFLLKTLGFMIDRQRFKRYRSKPVKLFYFCKSQYFCKFLCFCPYNESQLGPMLFGLSKYLILLKVLLQSRQFLVVMPSFG